MSHQGVNLRLPDLGGCAAKQFQSLIHVVLSITSGRSNAHVHPNLAASTATSDGFIWAMLALAMEFSTS